MCFQRHCGGNWWWKANPFNGRDKNRIPLFEWSVFCLVYFITQMNFSWSTYVTRPSKTYPLFGVYSKTCLQRTLWWRDTCYLGALFLGTDWLLTAMALWSWDTFYVGTLLLGKDWFSTVNALWSGDTCCLGTLLLGTDWFSIVNVLWSGDTCYLGFRL